MTALVRALAAPVLALDRARTDRGPIAVVALLVAVSACIAGALPLLAGASADAGLRAAVEGAQPVARNLEFTRSGTIPPGPEDPLALVEAEGQRLRADLPPLVGGVVSGQGLAADSIEHVVIDAPVPITHLRFRTQPGVDRLITWTEGRAPAARVERTVLEDRLDPAGVPYVAYVHEAAVSTQTAEALRLEVGDRLLLLPQPDDSLIAAIGSRNLGYAIVEIVGRFDIADPADPAWFDDPALRDPGIEILSLELRIYRATALIAPDAYPALVGPQPGSSTVDPTFPFRYRWRMEVDGSRFAAADAAPFLTELTRLQAAFPFLAVGGGDRPGLQTSLDDVIGGHQDQQRAAEAVLLVAAVGPAVAGIGVLALVALLLARRRAAATAVVRSRGASSIQVMASRALEAGAVVGLAALAGLAVAATFVTGPPGPGPSLAVLAVAGAAATLLIVAAWPSAGATASPGTAERASQRPAPRQAMLDLVLGVVAVVAVGALLGRGLQPGQAEGGPDPLLAAAPALLALAGGLLAIRLLPVPVGLAAGLLARRRDLVPVLAARTAARHPGDSAIPLLVVIVATAAGVFGSIVLTSVERGQDLATWRQVGADVRMEVAPGRNIPTPVLLADPPGVRARAEVRMQPGTVRGPEIGAVRATILAVDAEAMTRVLAGTPVEGAIPASLLGSWPPGATGTDANPIPVLVAPAMLSRTGFAPGITVRVEGLAGDAVLRVIGTIDAIPGLPVTDRTIVVPLEAVRATRPDGNVLVTHLLVAAEPGAVPSVEAAYREVAGGYAAIVRLQARSELVEALASSQPAGALRAGFAVSLAIALAYAALALVAGTLLVASARASQLAILRTLGLGGRGLGGLVLLELLPLVGVAVVAGLALGIAMAVVMLPAIGLGVFTGSTGTGIGITLVPVEVTVAIDPAWTLLFAVVPMLVVVGAVAAAVWLVARRNLAGSIRVGEA